MIAFVLTTVLAVALAASLLMLFKVRRERDEFGKGERMKQAFLNHVSHEIRTPLRAVNELANILKKEDLYLSKNEKRDISDQLQYNSSLIGTLVDELMVFTDTDAAGHPLKNESFSPNALCRRCLEANVYSIFHRQAVRLNFKRELSDEYFIRSDRHLVELIVNKLILNACRFTEQGEVLVGCNTSEQPGYLTIFVKDTGVGIPSSRMKSLFSWFEAPDDMKDEAELDLSICQKVAHQLGGILQITSTAEQVGTRMVLLLPVR